MSLIQMDSMSLRIHCLCYTHYTTRADNRQHRFMLSYDKGDPKNKDGIVSPSMHSKLLVSVILCRHMTVLEAWI